MPGFPGSRYGSPPTKWANLPGAPFLTVSLVGTANGKPFNNGADFGPDTPGTTTGGVLEAVNSAHSNGPNYVWLIDSAISTFGVTIPADVTVWQPDGAGGGKINGQLTVWANLPNFSDLYGKTYFGASADPTVPPLISCDSGLGTLISDPSRHSGFATDAVGIRATGVIQTLVWSGRPAIDIGFAPIRGSDIRPAVTAVDGAAITLFTNPSASIQAFRVTVGLTGSSGVITGATYTALFIRGGVQIPVTVSISAAETVGHATVLAQVDASSNITGQLTALTGTAPGVDITVTVEAITAGA